MWQYIKHRYSALNGNNRKHTSQDLDGCGILCQQELSSVSCLALLMPKENSWKENSIAGIALGKRQGFGPANFQNRWIYDDLWVSTLTWTVRDGPLWRLLHSWLLTKRKVRMLSFCWSFSLCICAGSMGAPHLVGWFSWCGLTRPVIWSHEILGPCMNMYESIMIIRKSTSKSKWNAYVKRILMALKKNSPRNQHHTTWYDVTVQGQASMPYISLRHSWSWPMC